MRWFTEAAEEADDDATWPRMLAEYSAHLSKLAPALPPDLARFALDPELHLHDGRFEAVEIDVGNKTVTLVVQVGYRRLSMRFTGAHVVPDNLQRLEYAIRAEFKRTRWSRYRTVTEILAQEIDLTDDRRFVLRLRLWPFHEFAVEFDDFQLTEDSVADRGPARAGSFEVRGTRGA